MITHVETVGSTNTLASELAAKGAPEGTVVLSDVQTEGRGRKGDRWFSRKGGLWFTLLLRPDVSTERSLLLPLLMGIAVHRAVERYGIQARIKLPNDVLVDGKKLCGILCENRIQESTIRYVVADLFEWWPTETYDFVFFGYWLSHVPASRFNRFWEMIRAALKPGGRAFFVDGLQTELSTAQGHAPLDESGVTERQLNDGRTFNIVKVFHDPGQLQRQLQDLGWSGVTQTTARFFYYGCMAATELQR